MSSPDTPFSRTNPTLSPYYYLQPTHYALPLNLLVHMRSPSPAEGYYGSGASGLIHQGAAKGVEKRPPMISLTSRVANPYVRVLLSIRSNMAP